ncbi:MAG: rod shape-determining protein RodA [Coriobacteriia bacterium]|nr:rod shape-determining protein RodA [Coriobacteriia bacterium]
MDKTPYRRFRNVVNLPLVVWTIALLIYGTIMVSSATTGMSSGMLRRQLIGIALGLVPLGAAWLLDYKLLKHWTGPLLVALSILLISPRIPGLGYEVGGATSWLQVFGVRLFQPSEPAKLIFIAVMAAAVADFKGRIDKPRDVIRVLSYVALALVLILLQPDLGTGLVFVAIAGGMLLVGGLKARWFLVLGLAAALALGGVVLVDSALDNMAGSDVALKDYQKDRLLVFIDNTRAPQGAGYNLAQSKIAIGSGGISGKGLAAGTQSNLHFLPERHTDFIFAVLGEELGFTGALMLLGLYLALLMSALAIATSSRDLYGALICAGIISMWAFQILENIGMTIGMMPITGIPLPFMSFGSSAMVTNLGAVGMLLSVWSRRYGT